MKYIKSFRRFVNEQRNTTLNEGRKDKDADAIADDLYKFDQENHKYRYKYFDVTPVGKDIYVDWVTQEDKARGKRKMMKLLKKHADSTGKNIYLYYNLRDDDRENSKDRKSKKGYEQVK